MPEDFSFSSLSSQAADLINADNVAADDTSSAATQPVDSQPPTGSEPVSTSPQPQSVADPASGQPPTDPTYDVDLGNGRIEKLTQTQLKEAYQNGLRQADYTRKTQELAKQRSEVEAVVQQIQAQQQRVQLAEHLLSNPAAMLAAAQQQLQAQQPQQQVDPNQPVTMAQLQSIMGQVQQQAQLQVAHAQQMAQQIVDDRLQVADYAETVNSTLGEVYKEFPILKARPEFEDVLRYNVAKTDPQTIEEAVQAFKTVSKEFAESISKPFIAQQQTQQAQRAKLAATGTEPPGVGSAPQPTAPSYRTNDGKLDWRKLQEAAAQIARG